MSAEFAKSSPQSNGYMHQVGIANWVFYPGRVSAFAKSIGHCNANFPQIIIDTATLHTTFL
jgi:hypothetical protein